MLKVRTLRSLLKSACFLPKLLGFSPFWNNCLVMMAQTMLNDFVYLFVCFPFNQPLEGPHPGRAALASQVLSGGWMNSQPQSDGNSIWGSFLNCGLLNTEPQWCPNVSKGLQKSMGLVSPLSGRGNWGLELPKVWNWSAQLLSKVAMQLRLKWCFSGC